MRAAFVFVLLVGCREYVVVGMRGTPGDAAADVSADAATDVSDDSAPDVAPPLTATERLGLHTRGVAVVPDGVDDANAIRFVYVGDDGRLHVERRRSDTLARACELVVSPPEGSVLASAPAAIDEESVVVVASRDGAGNLRYHALRSSPEAGPCGATLSPWEALPDAPAGLSFRSAPTAVFTYLDTARIWIVAALLTDGRVWTTERPAASPRPWSPWSPWPTLPPGEEAVSAPSADHEGAAGTTLTVLTQDAQRRRRQRRMSFYLVTRVWAPAWREEPPIESEADSVVAQRVFEVDPRYRQGPSPYGAWRAVRDVNGVVWAQSMLQRHGFADAWSAWQRFGDPFLDRGTKSTAPVIAPRRDARQIAGEMLFLEVPMTGPAVVRYTSAWFDEPVEGLGFWREAPDPLR